MALDLPITVTKASYRGHSLDITPSLMWCIPWKILTVAGISSLQERDMGGKTLLRGVQGYRKGISNKR